jgi:hypothetical protein
MRARHARREWIFMTEVLVRWGYPNLVAVVALALMPLVAAMTTGRADAQASPVASAGATSAGEIDVAGAEVAFD